MKMEMEMDSTRNKSNQEEDGDAAFLYDMEFKCKDDDAWYTVKVDLSDDDHTLTVKLLGFADDCDVKYTAGEFLSELQVNELVSMFRPASKQLQDKECPDVHPGLKVCAAHSSAADDLRFYDAVVEAVHHELHSSKDGEEECPCTFVLCWIHGPNRGNLTPASIGNLCTLSRPAHVNPRIELFSKRAMEKMKMNSRGCCILPGHSASVPSGLLYTKDASCLPPLGKSTSERGHLEIRRKTGCDNTCSPERLSLIGNIGIGTDQEEIYLDEDIGGDDFVRYGGPCYFLIDNLESDLSPSSISRFIKEHTFVSPEAYVFPRLSSVPYSSAAIVLDSRVELEKVYEFLLNPEHLIVSSRGRPWVLFEQELRHGTFRPTRGGLAVEYRDEFQRGNVANELKIVQSGTDAYKKAMEIKSLFMEFVTHEQKLYQRLAQKESMILESS